MPYQNVASDVKSQTAEYNRLHTSAVVNTVNNVGKAAVSGGSSGGGSSNSSSSSSGSSSSTNLITTWAANNGLAAPTYNSANNTINLIGQSYNVADIAAGKVAGLTYKAGHVEVSNEAAFRNTMASTPSVGVPANSSVYAINEQSYDAGNESKLQLAQNIRQNRGKYEQLFATFGETLSDNDINSLMSSDDNSTDIWRKVSYMQELSPYASVHKLYSPNQQFSLDLAKQYQSTYTSPEMMGKTIDAQSKLAAYGVDVKSLFKTFMNQDVTDTNLMDFYMGRESSATFQKQYELAQSRQEGATKQSQTSSPLAWEDNSLVLKGPKRSFI